MKNIFGEENNLELFNAKGVKVYEYYKSSYGYSWECTYDENVNERTYKNSNGYSDEITYDDKGNAKTYKNSDGVTRGFDIPEYTMEELTAKLGNFKIKK